MTLQIPISNVVSVSISTSAGGIQQTGYGVINILTDEDTYDTGERTRSYASITEVAGDWATSSDAYLMAAAIFAQEPAPETVKISTEAARVAQVQTIVFSGDLITSNVVNGTVDGVALTATTFATDNATTLAAIATKIQATDGVSTAVSDGSHTITVTAQNAGLPVVLSGFAVTLGASQATVAITTTTPSHGIADDLDEIIDADDDWYFLGWNEQGKAYQKAAGDYIEALNKQYVTVSSDADVKDATQTDDTAYYFKANTLQRSRVIYAGDATEFSDAALMGKIAPYDPGATVCRYQELSGITADELTSTEIAALNTKYAFYYGTIGGRNVVMEPLRTDGYYLDAIRDRDYVRSYVEENLTLFVINESQAGRKIPYTQAGINSFETQLRGILSYLEKTKQVISFEGIDEEDRVVFPVIGDVSAADKAARTLNDVSFTCKLQGAIYKFVISGLLTA